MTRQEAEARAQAMGHDLEGWGPDDTLGGHVARIFCRRCACALLDNDGVAMGTALVVTCTEARRSITQPHDGLD